jgi:tetratricopeptide (TPR) repeat protein
LSLDATVLGALMKPVISIVIILLGVTAAYSQEVTVSATTNKREVARILREGREAGQINRAFFDEHDRCRILLRAKEWGKAESSCRVAITKAERLPKEHVLERSSVRASLALALLWQKKYEEAILLLNKSVELRNTRSGNSDADTADLYYLLAQAHFLANELETARVNFDRAETVYRAAFVEMDDESLRASYSRRLRNALNTHYEALQNSGLVSEAEKVRLRLVQVEKDFATYLVD